MVHSKATYADAGGGERRGEQLADHYFQHIAPSAAAAALHGVGVDSLLMIAF